MADRTIERILALRRLSNQALNAALHFGMHAGFEESRLNREVWASHESGMRVPEVAAAHGIDVDWTRRIIREWRAEHNITIRPVRRKRQ